MALSEVLSCSYEQSAVGGIGLVMASVGIYSVIAQASSRRTQEIGAARYLSQEIVGSELPVTRPRAVDTFDKTGIR